MKNNSMRIIGLGLIILLSKIFSDGGYFLNSYVGILLGLGLLVLGFYIFLVKRK